MANSTIQATDKSIPPGCRSCAEQAGQGRISPGPTIYSGRYWRVEHAYPTSLRGWVVLVALRHVEALHELTAGEVAELGALQAATAHMLRALTGCEREYLACFAEAAGFRHMHVHVIPRAHGLDVTQVGPAIFAHLHPAPDAVVSPAEVDAFCREAATWMVREMRG